MADGFLGRWSRRKLDVKDGKPLEEPVGPPAPATVAPAPVAAKPAPAVPQEPEAPPPLTLDDVKSLTHQGDFTPYMAQGVAPDVKNAAMKKLFTDPRFNVMDGLDTYIDDYTKSDPIPAAMLRQMVGSQLLGLFDDEERKAKEAQEKALQARDDADNPPVQTVAQSHATPGIESPDLANKEHASQPGAQPEARVSQDHDAHTDLRLQPDDAAPAKDAGGGAQ